MTQDRYRELFGLDRGTPLKAPGLVERWSAEGVPTPGADFGPARRPRPVAGLGHKRDLLALSHESQPRGAARARARAARPAIVRTTASANAAGVAATREERAAATRLGLGGRAADPDGGCACADGAIGLHVDPVGPAIGQGRQLA